jgi:hypothetical protein
LRPKWPVWPYVTRPQTGNLISDASK